MSKATKEAITAQLVQQIPIADRINNLIELLNIQKVYFIDDANCKDVDVEIFLGKIRVLHQQEDIDKLDTVVIEDIAYTDPYDVLSENIKKKWPSFDKEKRLELLQKINKASEDQQAAMDYEFTPRIKDYFANDKLVYVDPFEWEAMLNGLSESLGENEKVFLIFDQDLKNAGGKFEQTTGVDLIIQIKETALKDKAICALLTHEIALTDQELYYREQIKDNNESTIDYTDFFPLSKKRLEEPEVFADGIKKTFINKHFETIKEETIKVVKESYGKALEKIKKFDTYDFDDAIIKSSVKEGVWEIETLLRITEIVQKDELQLAMAESGYLNKVNKEIKAAIPFGEIDFKIPENYRPYSDKAKIRHKEIYQSGDLINKLHKPIENGDIFEIDAEKFILVAQPCDMMVRGSGNKAGIRNAKYVTLLKIDTLPKSEFIKNVKKPNSMQHYLANKHGLFYFNDGTGDVGVVKFDEFLTVDVDILDLIVYNDSGNSLFNLPDNGFSKDLYNTAWELRFTSIKSKIESLKQKIDLSQTNVKTEVENRDTYIAENFFPALVVGSSSDKKYNVAFIENVFDFKIKRILNYKNPNASYLLDRYSRYLSRTAELHDFAQ